MRFVHPEVLWGMLALSVPIIVHLFNFRKFKKVAFSNVAFLKEIRQETHKTRNLKHLLILFSRMLAISCLVFAFARPYFPGNDSGVAGISAVSIYIDNSRSMEARGTEGILLEVAKNRAISIAETFSAADRFQLLTTDFEGKHQRLVSRDEFIQLVQDVMPSPSSHALSDAAQRQMDLLQRSGPENKFLFQLTDLQRTTCHPADLPKEQSIPCRIYPQTTEVISNIFVDSIWFDSPVHTLSRPDQLHVKLVNTGEEERKDIPIRWIVNEVPRSVGTITIPGGSSAEIELSCSFTDAGTKECRVEIDDSGITSDDRYYFNYEVLDIIPVLEIRGSNCKSNSITAIFSEDEYFRFRSMNENQIDFASLENFRFIVLHQPEKMTTGLQNSLSTFVASGGSVLLLPSPTADVTSYNELLNKMNAGVIQPFSESHNSIQSINFSHSLLSEAFEKSEERSDLPELEGYYSYTAGNTTETIARLVSGETCVGATTVENGNFYFIATPDDARYSNFLRHALFPAILIRMAESSAPYAPLAYELGNELRIPLRNFGGDAKAIKLKNVQDGYEFMPEVMGSGLNAIIGVGSAMTTPGNYQVLPIDSLQNVISFNRPHKESDNRLWDIADFTAQMDSATSGNWKMMEGSSEAVVTSLQNVRSDSSSLWYILIVWSLIFLAAEVLLLKYWR